MENIFGIVLDAFNTMKSVFIIITFSAVIAMVFWSVYLLNEVLLARKKLEYSIKYIIDGSISAIKRKCRNDIWKNALLLLIGTSESLSLLFAGLSTQTGFNLLNLTEGCEQGFSIKTYQLIQFPAATMLFMTIALSSLNIITVFFIGIYSYHTEKNNHKKLLVFLCIQTGILIPILLIPYTVVYGMFISICIMVISSYKWIKNTQRLLLYLKWRFEDMRDECVLNANQIKTMRRRYRRLIYIIILALEPAIASLFFDFLYQSINVVGVKCTQYYTLQYLDNLISSGLIEEIRKALDVLIILALVPVSVMLLVPYVLYTLWYMVGIVWRCVTRRRKRRDGVLTQSLLSY